MGGIVPVQALLLGVLALCLVRQLPCAAADMPCVLDERGTGSYRFPELPQLKGWVASQETQIVAIDDHRAGLAVAACRAEWSKMPCATNQVPVPTPEQAAYQRHEIMGLTHFNMATFVEDGDPACNPTNWNVGVHSSHASLFDPTRLNISNWVENYRAVGAKHAVLTAKHGCGFLLWNTSTTLPNGTEHPFAVARSSYQPHQVQNGHWFWRPGFALRSVQQMVEVYHMTVGNNQVLELDFAINDTGNVPSDASAVYHALGAWARACYGMPVANMSGNSSSVLLTLPSPATPVDRFILQEDIDFDERVRQWHIDVQVETGDWMPFANGTAIGHKRIVLGSGPSSSLTAARLTVDSAVASPVILAFAAFKPCPDP
ncbi:uncharacterized protein MONBRDRAFT_24875 [Monosiga brevicollis MX1]|uniref:alpha-L-fucosidase n=1 Tax=Monosiga brevicollis TaxID=81824 RepID=A9UY04_MONBE|nr:uncharacterized protein MONBRDRAFT_24875 [Monosiga brevicollis MX1]EDQ89938.1 predicted protein [Monosiga brevicollis MX1]|eukprot:XP_001745360.1 hypothetical protein [Monosiga brevicollis MX1]